MSVAEPQGHFKEQRLNVQESRMSRRVPVIGLVGSIGAGKSAVAEAFAARGGWVIDGDRLGHEALEQPDIRSRILQRWGTQGTQASLLRPDGRLDRRALAKIVFTNSAELRALESMVFPQITSRIQDEIAAAQADPDVPFVILDAAVMLEAGWNGVCDHLLYVDAPRSLRLTRLATRSGWTEADLTAREASQMSAEEKRARADRVLMNDASREELQIRVDRLLQDWKIGWEEKLGGEVIIPPEIR